MLRSKLEPCVYTKQVFLHRTIHLAPSIMFNYITKIVMNQGANALAEKKVRPKAIHISGSPS